MLWSGFFVLSLYCFNCTQFCFSCLFFVFLTPSQSFLIAHFAKLSFELIFLCYKRPLQLKWYHLTPTFFWNFFGSSVNLIVFRFLKAGTIFEKACFLISGVNMKIWPLNQTFKHPTWQFITLAVIAIGPAVGTSNSSKTHCLPSVAIKTGARIHDIKQAVLWADSKTGNLELPSTPFRMTSWSCLIKLAIKTGLSVKYRSFLRDGSGYVH